jgi:hypothetical protein
MTKKDFQLIAHVLRVEKHAGPEENHPLFDDLAKTFAAELARTNPRFDRQRFIDAAT